MRKTVKKSKLMRPELLVPAGSYEKLLIGLQYGADAFYLGSAPFSMRSRINNFTNDTLLQGVKLIHKHGKKAYITVNIYPRGVKIDAFKNHLKFLREKVKPDALILADPGVLDLVKECYPEAEIHISVQANALNYRAVKFWGEQGASRVILPRELTLMEIKQIHEKVPNMELEFFVHGAICMSYSGRCLLSNYFTGRDSNQGACAQSCRWNYKLYEGKDFYLEEQERKGEFMPVEEDEHGTYIMSSKDMCLLPYLKELADAGICSFKVEGRNKTEYYLATVTKVYREAIDDMMKGKKFNKALMDELMKTANRGLIPGFLFSFNDGKGSITLKGDHTESQTYLFAGIVHKNYKKKTDLYEVEIRNRLERGDTLEVMSEGQQFEMKLGDMWELEGEKIDTAHGGAGIKILKLKKGLPANTMIRVKV